MKHIFYLLILIFLNKMIFAQEEVSLTNPGFENGNVSGWSFWESMHDGISLSNTIAHTGDYSLAVSGDGVAIYQSLSNGSEHNFIADRPYKVSGYIMHQSSDPLLDGQIGVLEISFRDAGWNAINQVYSEPLTHEDSLDQWYYFEAFDTCPTSAAHLNVGFKWFNTYQNNAGTIYFDDLKLEYFPPPELENYSFEDGLLNWDSNHSDNVVITDSIAMHGAQALKISENPLPADGTIEVYQTLSEFQHLKDAVFSGWFYMPTSSVISEESSFWIQIDQQTNGDIITHRSDILSAASPNNTWFRVQVSAPVTLETSEINLRIGMDVPSSASGGGAILVDSLNFFYRSLSFEVDTLSDHFNYAIGVQTINPGYKFGDESSLIETAVRIRSMGSNIIKMHLGPMGYFDIGNHDYTPQQLLELEPSFNTVLNMDFKYYHFWCYGSGDWVRPWDDNNFSAADSILEYYRIYDIAEYLLTEFSGTGKEFYLGNWEGDWDLFNFGGQNWNPYNTPPQERVDAMTSWLNTRQQAVDDAKNSVIHDSVNVFHYACVNLVNYAINHPEYVCMTNSIIPNTNVDFVSYSSYETTKARKGYEIMRDDVFDALDFIESKLPEKEGITGKRIWIDEYGYNTACGSEFSSFEQMLYSKYVCQAGLEWEAPFVMYWEFYNNEVVNGVQCGYWMIDDENQKQPVYHLYHDFFDWAQTYVIDYEQANGSQPPRFEFGQAGSDFLSQYELTIGEVNQAIIPDDITLHPSYPNPFNPSNRISFQLDSPTVITLRIYDVLGREIIRLVDEKRMEPGKHVMIWKGVDSNGRSVSNGIYFIHLSTGSQNHTQKVTLLR